MMVLELYLWLQPHRRRAVVACSHQQPQSALGGVDKSFAMSYRRQSKLGPMK
jgi:hypothetical protein